MRRRAGWFGLAGVALAGVVMFATAVEAELIYHLEVTGGPSNNQLDAGRKATFTFKVKINPNAPAGRQDTSSVGTVCAAPTNDWAWEGAAPQIPQLTSRQQPPVSRDGTIKATGTWTGTKTVRFTVFLSNECPASGESSQSNQESRTLSTTGTVAGGGAGAGRQTYQRADDPRLKPIPLPRQPFSVKFGDYLHAKFQNGKCLNCHAFSDNNSAKRREHNTANRTSNQTDVGDSNQCRNCHNQSAGYPDGWRAPRASQNMNWSGQAASQTCQQIKIHNSTAGAMSAHLKNDPTRLVQWAVSGMGIAGEWNGKVDVWINRGMLCQ